MNYFLYILGSCIIIVALYIFDLLKRVKTSKLQYTNLAKAFRAFKDSTDISQLKADKSALKLDISEALTQLELLERNIEDQFYEFVLPTADLLDGLDILDILCNGEKLKEALQEAVKQSKSLAKNKRAIELYSETDGIEQAVLLAFNAKFEQYATKAKSENFGILSKKLQDVYDLLNKLGVDSELWHINDVYLEAKLRELRLLCAIQALKDQYKAEQKEINERLREDAKAQREIEAQMEESTRAEIKVASAIAETKRQMEQAQETQKASYELKLIALEQQLKEAQEKRQRAMSLAQQTKTGKVYVISNIGAFGENIYKIGMTRRLVAEERIDELGDASVPFPFDVHAIIESTDAPKLENALHRRLNAFQVNKVNTRKEFFRVSLEEIKVAVNEESATAHWTIIPPAIEYRETLKMVTSKPFSEEPASNPIQGATRVVKSDDSLEEAQPEERQPIIRDHQAEAEEYYSTSEQIEPGLNVDGQPTIPYPRNEKNNKDKASESFLGLCNGIIADGELSEAEVNVLRGWLKSNSSYVAEWPFSTISNRINIILEDGACTPDERLELLDLLSTLGSPEIASTLPLTKPTPKVTFKDKTFCITGKFVYGIRDKVFQAIRDRGGIPFNSNPTSSTDYLVIGTNVSRDWANTAYGRKIEKAVKDGIQIISEEHWQKQLI